MICHIRVSAVVGKLYFFVGGGASVCKDGFNESHVWRAKWMEMEKDGVGAGIYCLEVDIRHLFKLADHHSILQAKFLAVGKPLMHQEAAPELTSRQQWRVSPGTIDFTSTSHKGIEGNEMVDEIAKKVYGCHPKTIPTLVNPCIVFTIRTGAFQGKRTKR